MSKTNWPDKCVYEADNLHLMRRMNTDSVDLIYLDPPFKSDQEYAGPIGSEAAGAAFKDTWTMADVKDEEHGELAERNPALGLAIELAGEGHSKSMKAYLIYMGVRLLEMHRILKPTGSIYLHCDRLNAKCKQAAKGQSSLPATAGVVGFEAARIEIADVD